MMDTHLLHQLYVEELSYKIKKVLTDIEPHIEKHAQLSKILKGYEHDIKKYTNVTLEDVLTYNVPSMLNNIRFPRMAIYKDGRALNFKAISLYIQKYITYNNRVLTASRSVSEYKKQIVSYTLYYNVLKEFNNLMVEEVLERSYEFEGTPTFGNISVIKNYNKRNRVNWGASTKKKDVIIAKGGIPYVKADAEQDENYKGEKYLEYHPHLDYFLHWEVKSRIRKQVPALRDYAYKPARGTNSVVSKLQEIKQDRDKCAKRYTKTLKPLNF